MKKFVIFIFIFVLIVLPCVSKAPKQAEEDREVQRTMDYINAGQKKGVEKIDAMKEYIKKFPDKTNRWTKLAYFSMTTEYFQLKNFAQVIKMGKETEALGSIGPGEDARLAILIANAYGIKNSPTFNQAEALKYTNKAMDLANKAGDKQVIASAQMLKKLLSAPAKPNLTPAQKLKRAYGLEDWDEVAASWKGLSAADKGDVELHELYAKALVKSNNFDAAVNEFNALSAKGKKATYALNLGKIYSEKGKKNPAMLDKSIDAYLDAGFLYQKEGDSAKSSAAFKKAEYYLFEKRGYNKAAQELQRGLRNSQAQADKNAAAVKNAEKELKLHLRRLRKQYEALGMEPPPYEEEKTAKLEQKIEALKAGGSSEDVDKAKALEEKRKGIMTEFEEIKKKAKARLGL